MSAHKTDELLAKLTQKKQLLDDMFHIMQGTNQLLMDDDIGEFEAQTQELQCIVQKIDRLSKTIIELEARPESSCGSDAASVNESIRGVLQKIIAINKENNELARKKMESYKRQIRSINNAKKGIGAYAGPEPHGAVFFDTKK